MDSSSRRLLNQSTLSRVAIATIQVFPETATANDLGLVETIDRLGQGVVVAVSSAADGGLADGVNISGFNAGMYVMGLEWTPPHVAFAVLTAVFLTVGYSFNGAAWRILRTSGRLQAHAICRAKGGTDGD